MTAMQRFRMAFGAVALAGLVGCATSPGPFEPDGAGPGVTDGTSAAGGSGTGAGTQGATGALTDEGAVAGDPLEEIRDAGLTMVIYFDFDSSEVHPDDQIVVEAHAQYLARTGALEVVLEGHADERGSREYNVALGERRANTVRDMLRLLGVAARQVRIVSYGEERPSVVGHDEESWSRNRRVEFVYGSG